MSKVARTVVAGFGGALRGLIVLALACAFIALLPPVIVSYTNRGSVDLDAFLPRAAASTPSSSALVRITGSPLEQKTIRHALDELVWPVNASTFSIKVVPHQDLPDDPGMYYSSQSVICVDAAVVDDPVRENLPRVLAHEIGHAIDATRMDDNARAEFMSLRGFDPSTDWADTQEPWAFRPQEDFAEVFAAIDSPSSVWPIQTIGGRMKDAAALQSLIERYQPGPSRPCEALSPSTLLTQVGSAVSMVKDDTLVLDILLGMAIVCTSLCAIQSMDASW